MGWINWSSRKSAEPPRREPAHLFGLDLDATRARLVALRNGQIRLVPLEPPHGELALAISMEGRTLSVGQVGVAVTRRLPHLACQGYLGHLGAPLEWKAARHRFDAATATQTLLDRLKLALADVEGLSVALPAYLTMAQVKRLTALAEKAQLPWRGSAAAALALAFDGYMRSLHNEPSMLAVLQPRVTPEPLPTHFPENVVPLHRSPRDRVASRSGTGQGPGPNVLVVVELDDFAFSATLVELHPEQLRCGPPIHEPRLSLRIWKERLLDRISDRCVRLCRRDPRDSAVAEQALYEQLDLALLAYRQGQRAELSVRSEHWYQDISLATDEWEGFCAGLAKQAVDVIHELIETARLTQPPTMIWLTHTAACMPGLARQLHQHATERTAVALLHPDAIAAAAGRLDQLWRLDTLPRGHLDSALPLPRKPASAATSDPVVREERG